MYARRGAIAEGVGLSEEEGGGEVEEVRRADHVGGVSHDVIRQCETPALLVPRGNKRSVSRPSENGAGARPA